MGGGSHQNQALFVHLQAWQPQPVLMMRDGWMLLRAVDSKIASNRDSFPSGWECKEPTDLLLEQALAPQDHIERRPSTELPQAGQLYAQYGIARVSICP